MDQRTDQKVTKKITVWGMVQGVGFRPFVFRCAKKWGIAGSVRNVGGLVEIIAFASELTLACFLDALKTEDCENCEIVHLAVEEITNEQYSDFRIMGSGADEKVAIIPPDLPVCVDCERELKNRDDRRYAHPFISCMSCGPRYSIIEELPYDRHNTAMSDFEMCPACRQEYTSTEDRRFHAQTISCFDCGPQLFYRRNEQEGTGEQAFFQAVDAIKNGGIVAVKGIGGYHFCCSPFLDETVRNLRILKGREEKPFAVMFESISEIERYCSVSDKEQKLLLSNARPIVLLRVRDGGMVHGVGKGSLYLGAFLPYTPLQRLLLEECGPLIMTSANLSERPIIKDDEEMLEQELPLLDGILYHERRIVRRVDDSVARVVDNRPQMIRRSRGYVPYPISLPPWTQNKTVFAAGSDLKAAFCLYSDGRAVLSQYHGDLEQEAVMEAYRQSAEELSALFNSKPELAVCDLHPNYHSSQFAKSLGIPVLSVQHHHAHIASVIAEHHLQGGVIGVAFDGTGYGTDGHIWGGEFLICHGGKFTRAAHLRDTPILGGDASMKDAQKTATCFLMEYGLERFAQDDRKAVIQSALTHHVNTVLSSSMGRLFDAICAILGFGNINRYEGECGATLEKQAILAKEAGKQPEKLRFSFGQKDGITIADPTPILEALCNRKGKGDTGALALGFHYAVAELIATVCKGIRNQDGLNTVALSGGVFQNSLLSELAIGLLRKERFDVYYPIAVPPNDGGISLGQAYLGAMRKDSPIE